MNSEATGRPCGNQSKSPAFDARAIVSMSMKQRARGEDDTNGEEFAILRGKLYLAHIIHERFYCNRRYAATTSLGAGFRTQAHGLASRGLDVPFQVRLGLSGLRTRVSLGVLSVSSRTVMNNVG